jgi:hypothetical protein
MPDGRLNTWVGVALFFVVLLPSWPELLRPQHFTEPVLVTAHVWPPPAEIRRAELDERPTTPTGENAFVVVPSPSCPNPLYPQHSTLPSAVNPQE